MGQHKICPRCQTPAPLDAAFCGQCGRQYRTQFVPPQAPPVAPNASPRFAAAQGTFPQEAFAPRGNAVSRPAQWLAALVVAVLAFFLVYWLVGRRPGVSSPLPPRTASNPASTERAARVAAPPDAETEARRAVSETDPVTAQAQREVERAKRDLGLPPPADSVSPDGRIHLRSGGTIRKDDWDKARQGLQNSPLFKEPDVPHL